MVDSVEDDDQILRDIGMAAAFYLETTLKQGEVIGISSWSATILAMVDAMHPVSRPVRCEARPDPGGCRQPFCGSICEPLDRPACYAGAGEATLLPAPGVVGSADARPILEQDRFVRKLSLCSTR